MNVIIAYLETMFSAYPQTPRMLEAKAELLGMMEDAYTNLIAVGRTENEAVGQVIRDFGNLTEIAPELGIATEITPPASAPAATPVAATPSARPLYPPVTRDEAQGYAEAQRKIRGRVSLAIPLFVVSPIVLIVLSVLAGTPGFSIDSGSSSTIGILVLLVLVACGVMLLVSTARDLAPFSRIEEGKFSRNPEVTNWALGLAQQHEPQRIRALQVAILIWILSPAPLIALSLLNAGSPRQGMWSGVGVALVLVLVAIGLAVLLPTVWAKSTSDKLGGEGAASQGGNAEIGSAAEERSIVGVIAAFYWPLLTVIYLGWSFIGDAWSKSWLVWPIGAVLFWAMAAGISAWERYRQVRR